MTEVVIVDELRKSYSANPVPALNGVSFSVESGEVFGLLGPNGAGKSTTIGMLTTRIRPTSGRAQVAGVDIVAHLTAGPKGMGTGERPRAAADAGGARTTAATSAGPERQPAAGCTTASRVSDAASGEFSRADPRQMGQTGDPPIRTSHKSNLVASSSVLCEAVIVKVARSYLPATGWALSALGAQIAAARRELGWTAADLAERLGVNPQLVGRIEKGAPGTAIGTVLEAAILCGVRLFNVDAVDLRQVAAGEQNRLALLPARIHPRTIEVDDDF